MIALQICREKMTKSHWSCDNVSYLTLIRLYLNVKIPFIIISYQTEMSEKRHILKRVLMMLTIPC